MPATANPASPSRRLPTLPPGDWLPPPGRRPPPGPGEREVWKIVAQLRDACQHCGYRRMCAFAPVRQQIESQDNPAARKHAHERTLKQGLLQLMNVGGDWQGALVRMLVAREKDALLAGCLLSVAWRQEPARLYQVLDYTATRCGVSSRQDELAKSGAGEDRRSRSGVSDESGMGPVWGQPAVDPAELQQRMFRGQVLRLSSFFHDDKILDRVQQLLVLEADEEARLFQYEAVAALALLVARRQNVKDWAQSLEERSLSPIRATFSWREGTTGGHDLFVPYRRGNRRSYLYLRRDKSGLEHLEGIDRVRIDSLLKRMFLVFGDDGSKTHRVFKELCRHLNVRAAEYPQDLLLAGLERLSRDDVMILGIYAPALARVAGHVLGIPDYHLLVKLLYSLRSEAGRKITSPALPPSMAADPLAAVRAPKTVHEKVVAYRADWEELVEQLGAAPIKEVFQVLFRLNASYKPRDYTTPTYLRIGEVAYLLTAMAGWNPKGLEIELKKGAKALALLGYGLQPPGRFSQKRVERLGKALERVAEKAEDDQLKRAAELSMVYMAVLHGYDTFQSLSEAVKDEDWEPPLRMPSRINLPAVTGEDFSEFAGEEDSHDSLAGIDPNMGEDVFIVLDDDQVDALGNIETQKRQRLAGDDFLDDF